VGLQAALARGKFIDFPVESGPSRVFLFAGGGFPSVVSSFFSCLGAPQSVAEVYRQFDRKNSRSPTNYYNS